MRKEGNHPRKREDNHPMEREDNHPTEREGHHEENGRRDRTLAPADAKGTV